METRNFADLLGVLQGATPDRKVLVVTDSGVPEQWVRTLAEQCEEAEVFRMPAGETN